MHKIKDHLLLLFWGTLGGVAFVGCILAFGHLVNWINAQLNMHISPRLIKFALRLLICAIVLGLIKTRNYWNNKLTHKQAAEVFAPELLDCIYKEPLAKAVVERRKGQINALVSLPDEARMQALNTPVCNGLTLLHIAAALGRTKLCDRLLALGADLQAQDDAGKTPTDYAAFFNRPKTLQFLQSYYMESHIPTKM